MVSPLPTHGIIGRKALRLPWVQLMLRWEGSQLLPGAKSLRYLLRVDKGGEKGSVASRSAPASGAEGPTPSCCCRLTVSMSMRVDVTSSPANWSMTMPQTRTTRGGSRESRGTRSEARPTDKNGSALEYPPPSVPRRANGYPERPVAGGAASLGAPQAQAPTWAAALPPPHPCGISRRWHRSRPP
jgi:hypothetical protein